MLQDLKEVYPISLLMALAFFSGLFLVVFAFYSISFLLKFDFKNTLECLRVLILSSMVFFPSAIGAKRLYDLV